MIKLTVLFAALFSCFSLFAQNDEFNYAKYKKEIGIDFQYIFSNAGIGTSLVFKVRKPETGLIAVNEKAAYRFKFSLSGNIPVGKTQIDTLTSGIINFYDSEINSFYTGFSVGLERQINRKRLQYSYGVDLGYSYYQYQYARYYRITSSQSGKTEDLRNIAENISHGPSLVPFFGFKYFILPEISVSIETGLGLSFSFNRYHETEQIIPDQEIETIQKSSNKEIRLYFDYLRALNLSYYF